MTGKKASLALLPLLAFQLFLMAGCQAPMPGIVMPADSAEIVSRSTNFLIITSRPDDTFKAIAARYYGHPGEAYRLTSINPRLDGNAGQLVAIPVRPQNPSGVYPRYYKTIPVLCYHQFTKKNKSRHPLVLQQNKFRRQLQYLKDNEYQVLRLEDLETYLSGEQPIPDRSVILTIDDGYRSIYTVAYPILKEFNYPATVFLYTDFIGAGAALNWSQINQLQKTELFDFQSHAKSHSSLATSPTPDQKKLAFLRTEITHSDRLIEKKMGHKPEYFSYPYGDSSDAAVALLRDEGYRLAFTVQTGGNPVFADPMRLRRAMIYDSDSMNSFRKKLKTKVTFR